MQDQNPQFKISKFRLFISLVILVGIVAFITTRYGEAQTLGSLIWQAKPTLLLVALGLQVATYICDGAKWHLSIKSNGYGLKVKELGKMALQQLSINQFVPSVGVAGNAIVASEMLKLNIPAWVVMKAMCIDILSLFASYVFMSGLTLYFLYDIAPPLLFWTLAVFLAFILTVTIAFWHFLYNHRRWRILNHLKRFKIIRLTLQAMSDIPESEKLPGKLFFQASILRVIIFILDGFTLWVLMLAIGSPVVLETALIALAAGSVGGVISFLPGGIGGYEIASIWTLILLGTPLEAAIAGTLLLRGFVLWLPLIPGLIFARKQIFPYELLVKENKA